MCMVLFREQNRGPALTGGTVRHIIVRYMGGGLGLAQFVIEGNPSVPISLFEPESGSSILPA